MGDGARRRLGRHPRPRRRPVQPAVPAGRYATEAFAKAGVPVPPASLEPDVRAVLTKVVMGEADVYAHAGGMYEWDSAAPAAVAAAVGLHVSRIDGYGKGSIVGTAGELEHGALWHVPGGYAMRDRLGI